MTRKKKSDGVSQFEKQRRDAFSQADKNRTLIRPTRWSATLRSSVASSQLCFPIFRLILLRIARQTNAPTRPWPTFFRRARFTFLLGTLNCLVGFLPKNVAIATRESE